MTAKECYDKYAHESYQNSFDHGFWEGGETRSKGEMVKLMISETSECQEADRKGDVYNPTTHMKVSRERDIHGYFAQWAWEVVEANPEAWENWFRSEVKDTTGDKLADVAIRIMDYVEGWRCHFFEREYRKPSMGNFSHDLLRIDWYILLAFEQKEDLHPGKDWGYALAAVCKFAEVWNIDLDWHIEQKQRYNRSRPYRHSKKY